MTVSPVSTPECFTVDTISVAKGNIPAKPAAQPLPNIAPASIIEANTLSDQVVITTKAPKTKKTGSFKKAMNAIGNFFVATGKKIKDISGKTISVLTPSSKGGKIAFGTLAAAGTVAAIALGAKVVADKKEDY